MLSVKSKEWDEYFFLCEEADRFFRRNDERWLYFSKKKMEKLTEIQTGVPIEMETDSDILHAFLKGNQMSSIWDVLTGTGLGHDEVKTVFATERDRFFVLQLRYLEPMPIVYAVLEPPAVNTQEKKAIVSKWMEIAGYIDPVAFERPIGIGAKEISLMCRKLSFKSRTAYFGDSKCEIFIKG